jgi:branched-chain amino acid transport system ATP-binding protein
MLSIEELSAGYGGIPVLNGITISIEAGEFAAIVGPNGAGKTTLFNLISGDIALDTGHIFFAGEEVSGLPPHRLCRRGMGRTFQITSIFRRLTVLENVQTAFLSHHHRHFNLLVPGRRLYRDEALALLERVGLREQAAKPSGILAHGDQRRLELAIALAGAPKLLLMDEPTAGMAPKERAQLMELVHGIARERGLGVLFTEHDMDAVFAHADDIIVLVRGEIIAAGRPDQVRANVTSRSGGR